MRDRDLVRLYWPVELRPAFDALFGIDAAMADVVTSSSEPAVGAIRLAWWREALERLDVNPPPPEPRLQAVAAELLPRGITASELTPLEIGWLALFEPFPWPAWVADAVAERGRHLFALASTFRDFRPEGILDAGSVWALVDVARHCSDLRSRGALLERARSLVDAIPEGRIPKQLRPLTMLTVLAFRDLERIEPFEAEATPGRALSLLSHRLFGFIN